MQVEIKNTIQSQNFDSLNQNNEILRHFVKIHQECGLRFPVCCVMSTQPEDIMLFCGKS